MIRRMLLALFVLFSLQVNNSVLAENSQVYKFSVQAPMQTVYPAVYESLEKARFFVVFEPDIGKNMQRFADKWGDTYNKNKLTAIRSMVFCNVWYANAVANLDPDMLALCPLRLSLYEKQGVTFILFARPTVIAGQSKAKEILQELEQEVVKAIQQGIKNRQP